MVLSARDRLAQFRETQKLNPSSTATTNEEPTGTRPNTKTAASGYTEYAKQHAEKHNKIQSAKPLAWWTQQPLWLKITLWTVLFLSALALDGLQTFFIFGGFVIVYAYTRETTAVKGQLSAYSVFNKGCQKLAGTFDAQQFEDQMRGKTRTIL